MGSALRSALVAVAASSALFMGASALSETAGATTPSYPAHLAAPYLQASTGDIADISADMSKTGLKYYTLAFLDSTGSGCNLAWEADDTAPVNAFEPAVKSLQSKGGNVIISFGGAGSTELAETCTSSASSLEQAYAQVLTDYPGVTRLDFDIEDPAIGNSAANSLRNQALAMLEKSHPSVSIDYTLQVAPSGLPSSPELSLLKQAKADKVKVNEVNVMTQYFGPGDDLKPAESAATGTDKQLAKLYGVSTAKAWHLIGLTPYAGAYTIGSSPTPNEDFSTSDAKALESWAASSSRGVRELSFWQLSNDAPKYTYSDIFKKL